MEKLFFHALLSFCAISFVACENFTKIQETTTNRVNQKQTISATNEKTYTRKSKDLKGAKLLGFDEQGRKQEFLIKDVELDPKDPEKETYLYTVFYQDKADFQWKNLCHPDIHNVAKAIPLSGSWDATGTHIESDKLITFACTNGVLAKCARFGYKPWKKVKGKSLRDFHQACTRMLRADYCGNGKGHTREGTPVYIYDVLDIQTQTPNTNGMVFEAAWGPNGATCINRPRWLETLSEIGSECPEKLKERTNEGGTCTTAQKAKQNWSGSLIFNDSFVRKR